MNRAVPLVAAVGVFLGAVSAAHVTLTHGGLRKVVERAQKAREGREELVVGHLPVT